MRLTVSNPINFASGFEIRSAALGSNQHLLCSQLATSIAKSTSLNVLRCSNGAGHSC
jgi:hypothetical protein